MGSQALAARGAGARRSSDTLQRRRRHGGGGGGGAGESGLRGELRRWLPLLCRPPFPGLTCSLGRKLTSSPGKGSGSNPNPPKPPHPPPFHAALHSSPPPRPGRAAPSNAPSSRPRAPAAGSGRPGEAQRRPEGVESRVPASSRGRGGKGCRKTPAWEGAALSADRCVLRPGSGGRVSPPRIKGKQEPLLTPALSVPPQPACPGRAPRTQTRVLSTRSSRTFPARPRRALPPHAPASQPLESPLPHLSPFPWCGKETAEQGRPECLLRGRRTSPNRAGGIGYGASTPSLRERPGTNPSQGSVPSSALGGGLGSGEFSGGRRQLPLSEARGGVPSPIREGGD